MISNFDLKWYKTSFPKNNLSRHFCYIESMLTFTQNWITSYDSEQVETVPGCT